MIKRIMARARYVVVVAMVSVTMAAWTMPSVASAAGCSTGILTFPTWYDGVVKDDCTVMSPEEYAASVEGADPEDGVQLLATRIGLNIAEIILQLVAYGTLVMIIKGGFDYMTSNGEQSKMASAKNSIRNAVVGLVIALASVAIVNFVGAAL